MFFGGKAKYEHVAARMFTPGHQGLIHRGDRGVQYASLNYVALLQAQGIAVSMTNSGHPKENAQAECINETMKNELLYPTALHSLQEARESIAEKVVCYNALRPHMGIGNRCPCEMAQATGLQAKLWRSWRVEASLREHKVPGWLEASKWPLRLRAFNREKASPRPSQPKGGIRHQQSISTRSKNNQVIYDQE